VDDVVIWITIDIDKYHPVKAPNIGHIELRKGRIIYDRLGGYGIDIIHKETYEEAKRLYLKHSRKNV
jgi:hypothetical protein